MDELLAPNFLIEVQGHKVQANVSKFIERVEYESVEGIVDMMKMTVLNPDFTLSELKLFLPGNELSLYLGYGPKLEHIGRCVIVNTRCPFPLDGMPMIEVTAYSKSHYMQEVRPDPDPPSGSKPKGGKT